MTKTKIKVGDIVCWTRFWEYGVVTKRCTPSGEEDSNGTCFRLLFFKHGTVSAPLPMEEINLLYVAPDGWTWVV